MTRNIFIQKKINWVIIVCVVAVIGIVILDLSKIKIQNIKNNLLTKTMENKMVQNKSLGTMPTWDLKDLYKSLDDPQINKDIQIIQINIDNFIQKYKAKISILEPDELYNAIKEYEDVSEKMGKIGSYSYLKYAENLSIDENIKFYQKISELSTNLSAKLVFFSIEINELDEELLKVYLTQSKNLQKYKKYLDDLRLFKKYQLSQELEEMLTEQSITASQAWVRLFDETIDNMSFEFKGETLNEAQILEIVNGSDKKARVEAGKVFGETLGKQVKLFAYITNTLAKNKSILDNKRGFKTPIQSRNLSNLIEDEVVEALYKTVQNNYKNISHRYYKLKAKILGQEKLHYTDRNAPLPFDNDTVYSYEDAVMIVQNAYSKFSPKMSEIGQKFFDNNWIDVPTRQGKRGGAFMSPTTTTAHPYILLNYQGKTRDVMTLAHELGHGIHQYLANDNGYFMADTPLTLAETASVFGEQLVFRYLLEKETNKEKKIIILANKIEDMINTVVRQVAFLEFEKMVHDERKNGEISIEKLNEMWMSVQQNSLGDIFEFGDEYKYYWTYIPHFIHSPFYVYAYAFGDCLVNSLYYQYMKNPKGFEDKYIKLLKAGGSKNYNDLLKEFNLNAKDPNFWQNGINMIIDLINELEKLL